MLDDSTANMPEVSAAADKITETVEQKKSDNNGTPSENLLTPAKPEKRGRGRPKTDPNAPKSAPSIKSKVGAVSEPGQPDNSNVLVQQQAAALFMTQMIERSGIMIADEKTAKMADIEKTGMAGCFMAYFQKVGLTDIPPGVALVLVTGQYYARVLTSPPARPKTAFAVSWFKAKIAKLRKPKYAQSDSGNDSQRENDTGKEARPAV